MPDCSCASRHSVSADISISSDQTTSVPYSPTRTRRNKSRDWRRGSRHGTSRSNRTRQRGSRRPYPNGCARLEASCPPSRRQCAAKSSSASSTSFVEFSPFEGQHLSIGLRPCQHLSDLGRARFSSNHHQIRNPHQHLKVRQAQADLPQPIAGACGRGCPAFQREDHAWFRLLFQQFGHGQKIDPSPGRAEGFSEGHLCPDILHRKSPLANSSG